MPLSTHDYNDALKIYTLRSDKVEAVVGDEKQVEFMPRLKLKVWDNECNLSIGVPVTAEKVAYSQNEDGVISWQQGKNEARFYSVDNGYEFEVVLSEPPKSNVIEFTLNDAKELVFYYQPELTKEEVAEGHVRPDDVVGSYAVYHASRSNVHKGGDAEKYKVGKAFHIYRPKIYDADKKWTWGVLNIQGETLTVTIPQK